MIPNRAQLIDLAAKCLENVEALVNEAELLLDHGHYSRCAFLSFIAGEEVGKHIMLLSVTVRQACGPVDWGQFWRRFRNHKEKSSMIDLVESVALTEGPYKKILDSLSTKAFLMEQCKLSALYVDFMAGEIRSPAQLISPSLASEALTLAKKRLALVGPIFKGLSATGVFQATDEEFRKTMLQQLDDYNAEVPEA